MGTTLIHAIPPWGLILKVTTYYLHFRFFRFQKNLVTNVMKNVSRMMIDYMIPYIIITRLYNNLEQHLEQSHNKFNNQNSMCLGSSDLEPVRQTTLQEFTLHYLVTVFPKPFQILNKEFENTLRSDSSIPNFWTAVPVFLHTPSLHSLLDLACYTQGRCQHYFSFKNAQSRKVIKSQQTCMTLAQSERKPRLVVWHLHR